MKRANLYLAAALGVSALGTAVVLPATPILAQGTTQRIATTKVDVATVATGHRSSKIVGAKVVNDQNDTVGTVDDLIISPKDSVPYAILSVGGFLGVGDRLVAVPYSALQITDDRIELPGGNKDALKNQPAFHYAKS
ncbi:PRC-barrel domain-containing protein [Nitrospirillum sp. BR 11163]|uniref:PRC-barrel domain-containing protein n=1 Tax=Nitrospirillum sp. BR 11163 TaxID=3104323 RepID=UPI002AFF068C|nr:PRC-barrel domain-containing protein [Nitrospirillum sp. BR 11163]MEA1673555.1 PRC-barrel domain-containing protein [Nitrospirillum sp. BR 11163]